MNEYNAHCNSCGHEWTYKANDSGICPKCKKSNLSLSTKNGENYVGKEMEKRLFDPFRFVGLS
jgi:Zn finger protein HypA/HybF involved in hydrogenase expression